jgi:hypothetical protein
MNDQREETGGSPTTNKTLEEKADALLDAMDKQLEQIRRDLQSISASLGIDQAEQTQLEAGARMLRKIYR